MWQKGAVAKHVENNHIECYLLLFHINFIYVLNLVKFNFCPGITQFLE